MRQKPSALDRTAADWNYVAAATCRRRSIPRAGYFLINYKFYIPRSQHVIQILQDKRMKKLFVNNLFL